MPRAHRDQMSTEDPELTRLREIEKKARALRDRLHASRGLISDPGILDRAEEIYREARAAVEARLALRSPSG